MNNLVEHNRTERPKWGGPNKIVNWTLTNKWNNKITQMQKGIKLFDEKHYYSYNLDTKYNRHK